jgi:NAD(P)H-dependent FMN reductase
MHLVVICSTNRVGALARKLAIQTSGIYQAVGHSCDLLDMAELPASALDPQAYKCPSADLLGLIDRFLGADGVHFVVSEYNGSFPGVLKLFIDLLPYPQGLDNRPCALIGLAAGQFKGLRAVEQLQQIAGYRNALQFPRRLFLGDSQRLFNDQGRLADPELVTRLEEQCAGFLSFIAAVKRPQ